MALLNRKITVQKNTVVTNAIGNHTNEWEDFYSCYTTINGESPNESTSAGTVVDNTKADFTVRWCKAVNMGRNVPIGSPADTIMDTLEEYADLAAEDVKQTVKDARDVVKDDIRSHA